MHFAIQIVILSVVDVREAAVDGVEGSLPSQCSVPSSAPFEYTRSSDAPDR